MERKKWVVAMLVGLTAITAGSFSTSLAWYVSATMLQVENLEVKLKTEHNLLISTEMEGNYVSELTTKDLAIDVGAFSPVSTMFESRWRDGNTAPKFYEYTSNILPSTGIPYGPEERKSGFYTTTLYLRSDDDVYVTLDRDFSYVRAYEYANEKQASALMNNPLYAGYTKEEIYDRLNGVSNAMRMSFYFQDSDQYFILDPNKDGSTYYGGILDNSKSHTFDTYVDKNGDSREVVYGEYNDFSYIRYGERLTKTVSAVGEYTCFNADHSAHSYPFDAEASKEAGLAFKEEPSLSLSDLSDDPDVEKNPFAVRLDRNVPKAFNLSIYLEGWDYDCVNAVMGASFLAGLQFKILREAY